MILSKIVAVAVKLGYAAIRSAEGTVTLAADGSAISFPVFSERTDAGATVAAGLSVALVAGDIDRETYVKLGAGVTEFAYLMPTTDGTWITATTGNYAGAQALETGASGDVIKARAISFKLP
jgi:hypothetical protein